MQRYVTDLFVHQDVDDGVNDGAALGEERRDDAGHGADDPWPSKGGHHGNDAVRHPADQVTHHRGDDHEQDVKISATSCRVPDTTHLTDKTEEEVEQIRTFYKINMFKVDKIAET